ncbi:family 43 glycosylhydrolase [Nocardia sp. SYP-A9097]|uniref:family 43 glycosylhydrolase n=1 Tax=Nocardia sp. SYP-A9097 TaxID=2663237 RepID=UPI00129B4E4C|nr:family 43 glycosylhydrolase [Nocardia sp. SYP-A9097]MRH89124.1 family 43 glycosylhydrolase [Nocardia sp. SYP-A9097]
MRQRVTAGRFRRIFEPERDGGRWYVNDHTVIRDAQGRWHMFGITHREPADPFDETVFLHATAKTLTGSWTQRIPVLRVDRALGETHLWAPFVVHDGERYLMFYDGGGRDRTATGIRLATSTNLFDWTRHGPDPLFRDGYDARDPMVLRIDGEWVMYYCATSTPEGGNHVVAYRTSPDLLHWSERRIAYTDPSTGTEAGNTESPFVVREAGHWYLFIGPRPDYTRTEIFRSDNPFHFRHTDCAGRVAAHAAEVVWDAGQYWITRAGWGQRGVWLAPLRFPSTVDLPDSGVRVPQS